MQNLPFIFILFGGILGLGLLSYFLPKIFGYPKTGRILLIAYGLIVLLLSILIGFEDVFFTKSDAKKLIEEQGILLNDEFELVDNVSSWAIGDYYHTFVLNISTQDRIRAIDKIKSAEYFIKLDEPIDDLFSKRREGPSQTQNYETKDSYVLESLKINGTNYAPTFRRIMINKRFNVLTFQDIVE